MTIYNIVIHTALYMQDTQHIIIMWSHCWSYKCHEVIYFKHT
jgi:hypothetical protein